MKNQIYLLCLLLGLGSIQLFGQSTDATTSAAAVSTSTNATTSTSTPTDTTNADSNNDGVYYLKSVNWNTNFTIPAVRFNRVEDDDDKKGTSSYFSSVGAGVSFEWGNLTRTWANGKRVKEEFANVLGVQLGFLFSAENDEENRSNKFALTGGLNVLDFQLGIGYELGEVPSNQNRTFYTIAYAVPLTAFNSKNNYVIRTWERTRTNKVEREGNKTPKAKRASGQPKKGGYFLD